MSDSPNKADRPVVDDKAIRQPLLEKLATALFERDAARTLLVRIAGVSPATPLASAARIAAERLDRLATGFDRYELVRTLAPYEHDAIRQRNLAGERYDDIIDAMVFDRRRTRSTHAP